MSVKNFRNFIFLIISIIFFSSSALADVQVELLNNKLKKLTENIYAYVDAGEFSSRNSYGANVGVIVGNNGVLVIDTLASSKEAKELINNIRQITDKPIKWVVNTHYHADHSLGNSEFAKLGAQIISSEETAKDLREKIQNTIDNIEEFGMTKEQIEGTIAAYPSITFTKKITLNLGDDSNATLVEIYNPGHSHSNGSSFVYLPEQKVLFAGDILFTGVYPFLGEGNIDEWSKILDYLMTFNASQIIPGHGPVSTNKDLKDMKVFISLFDKEAKRLTKSKKNNKKNIDEISSELIKVLPQKNGLDFIVKMNVQMKYVK